MTLSAALHWNVSYKIFHRSDLAPATTSFVLMCEQEYHFVNKIENFTAVCGFDGYLFSYVYVDFMSDVCRFFLYLIILLIVIIEIKQ